MKVDRSVQSWEARSAVTMVASTALMKVEPKEDCLVGLMGEMMAKTKAVNSVLSSDSRMVVQSVDNSDCYSENLMAASMVWMMVEMRVWWKDARLETRSVEKTVHLTDTKKVGRMVETMEPMKAVLLEELSEPLKGKMMGVSKGMNWAEQ